MKLIKTVWDLEEVLSVYATNLQLEIALDGKPLDLGIDMRIYQLTQGDKQVLRIDLVTPPS